MTYTGLNGTRYHKDVQPELIKNLARECGFELAGIASAEPIRDDFARYQAWVDAGMAGEMRYLTDYRADIRRDPQSLLPHARSIICVGKLYNQASPPGSGVSPVTADADQWSAIIARYAWGRDYHDVLREGLEKLAHRINAIEHHDFKICVDTAPLLERSYARQAGLGWIGKNACLINEPLGSWFFLGEIITTLAIEASSPPPDRCGTCTRCIEACPTDAIVPVDDGYTLDARRCISYLNIELRGPIPEPLRADMGNHLFGCDICQDVCPWNSRAPETLDAAFTPTHEAQPLLQELAGLSLEAFRERYRHTAINRAKYDGFLRNVAVAMGASGSERFREPLDHLTQHPSELVAEHARWALRRIDNIRAENFQNTEIGECV